MPFLIATPLSMHYEMAVAALDADKHVYCEKSLAHNIEQTLALHERVKASEKIFQVGYQYHSSRLYYKIVETIREGWIGTITGFVCQWNRNGDWRRPGS